MKRALLLAGTLALSVGLLVAPAFAQEAEEAVYVRGLIIEKVVEGDAPDGAEFDFAVECTAEEGGSVQEQFTLAGGDSHNMSDIEPGSTCTITESIPEDADFEDIDFFTSFEVSPADVDHQVDGRSITIELPWDAVDDDEWEDANGFANVGVVVTNDFGEEDVLGSGELVVTKRVSGDADGEWDFEVDCPGSVQDTVTLSDGESATFSITRGVNTSCTITELDPDGFDVSHTIDDGDEVEGAEASFVFDDEEVPVDVDLVREVEFTNAPEDDTEVLADTGFEVSWGLLLAAGLLIPGTGAVLYARRRDRKGVA